MNQSAPVQSPIAVCTALDAGYLPLALVVAKSIAATSTSGRPVVFHILYCGPDSPVTRRIESWQDPVVRLQLHRAPNPWADIGRLGRWGKFPPATVYRGVIPDVLADCDRAIYLDVDLVVKSDLAALFDADLKGHPIGAAIDIRTIERAFRDTAEGAWLRGYLRDVVGLDTPERISSYVQTGVMLLDLKRMREVGYVQRFDAIVRTHRSALMYADQCATNAMLRDDIALLSPSWNVAPYSLGPSIGADAPEHLRAGFIEQRAHTHILHFAGRKPWKVLNLPGARLWWRYAFETGVWWPYATRLVRSFKLINPKAIERWRARMAARSGADNT